MPGEPTFPPPPPVPSAVGPLRLNPLAVAWEMLSRPLRRMFRLDIGLVRFVFLLLSAIWAAIVWAWLGGALTRMAAVQLTLEERLPLRKALDFARQKWAAYFWAPFYPIIGAAVVSLPVIALGWLLRWSLGAWVVAVLWPVALGCGLVMAVILLGLLVGWPLMWATVSVEGTDTFDALSRSYAYSFQRPLHYLFYAVVASLLGVLGWLVVFAFGWATVYFGFWAASWSAGHRTVTTVVSRVPDVGGPLHRQGQAWPLRMPPLRRDVQPPGNARDGVPSGAPADALQATDRMGTSAPDTQPGDTAQREASSDAGALAAPGAIKLLAGWVALVRAIVLGFAFSFFWTTATAVYLVLRHDVDATPIDEVYLDEEEQEASQLPPLQTDAKGAPLVADKEDENGSTSATGNETSGSNDDPKAGLDPRD